MLFLDLDQLRLDLLGLIVQLDKVTLKISANSAGGVLGSLFCQIANTKVKIEAGTADRLTQAARQTGLTSGVSFAAPLAAGSTAVDGPCKVLDLVLGPLDLNLLGLIVNLNKVHLTITADRTGGVLGSLFCSLAAATPVIPALPPLPAP